jgi:predicted RNase H-like nuclease (RuvC/YqgF family)
MSSLSQLSEAREAVLETRRANQQLEKQLAAHQEHVERLGEANDILSQRALTLADEMEQEKRVAHARLEREIESLRKQLKASDERVDDERARYVAYISGSMCIVIDSQSSLQ